MDGTLSVRGTGYTEEAKMYPNALPVCTVATKEQAESVRVRFGALAYCNERVFVVGFHEVAEEQGIKAIQHLRERFHEYLKRFETGETP